ncbi:Hypothetical protein EPM1_3561 [Stenotrophomonas maltophilia EPM1]|nr:Hypothetical protein EPM1_3561 [Stenotrophomonas maltophilia EPM1]
MQDRRDVVETVTRSVVPAAGRQPTQLPARVGADRWPARP